MVLTVHHLHVAQSERIPWLCEELSIPYELKTYNRAPVLAPPEYQALHPAGTAPVIQDTAPDGRGVLTLAESGACIEYICHRHGGGRLFLAPEDPAYPDFLYWWHWANGTFQPLLLATQFVSRIIKSMPAPAGTGAGEAGEGQGPSPTLVKALTDQRLRRCLTMLNERLEGHTWLAGDAFTVADVMLVFSLTTMRRFFPYSLAEYPAVLAYLQRIGAREAYRRAMAKADPGMEPLLGAEVQQAAA